MPFLTSKPRIALLILAAVATVALSTSAARGSNHKPAPVSGGYTTSVTTPVPAEAKFTSEARHVVSRFILTAVARKHLEEAWTLVGPNLKGGLSKKEWLTGNNPVVPFPIDDLLLASYKIDYSHKDSALLEVMLLPRKNARVGAQTFFLEVKKVGTGANARWVVDNWVPRGSAVIAR